MPEHDRAAAAANSANRTGRGFGRAAKGSETLQAEAAETVSLWDRRAPTAAVSH